MQNTPALSELGPELGPEMTPGIDWPALERMERTDDAARCYRVLVADLVGLLPDSQGKPDPFAFADHVRARGARFLPAGAVPEKPAAPGIVFEYHPQLSQANELVQASAGYDAVIAAATFIPAQCSFPEGGVRIGAGTANMASRSWTEGSAPLMNTPGFNSRATAQMVFKALLRERPDLPFDELHRRVAEKNFDTGVHLQDYPTSKLEGQSIAVLGFGNIGREVALLARTFGMQVRVYARPAMQRWIEAEGFVYCDSIAAAAAGADVLSPHLGLGAMGPDGYANAGVVDAEVLGAMTQGSVLINFDRGELVDTAALAGALQSGQIGHAAIDADVFLPSDSAAEVSGPMAAYLALLANSKVAQRVLLLPHAAADTDHPSRVAGAKQAADQIIAAIRYRCVANAVGTVPAGFTDLGRVSVTGVGNLGAEVAAHLASDKDAVNRLRAQLAEVDDWLVALAANTGDANNQSALLALNQLVTNVRRLGLLGPGKLL